MAEFGSIMVENIITLCHRCSNARDKEPFSKEAPSNISYSRGRINEVLTNFGKDPGRELLASCELCWTNRKGREGLTWAIPALNRLAAIEE